jgi:RNA exonuclease 4
MNMHNHQHMGGHGNLSIQPPHMNRQIKPPPVCTRHLEGPFFAIDVECVATGKEHDARAVARIAMVDDKGETIFDEHVKPTVRRFR